MFDNLGLCSASQSFPGSTGACQGRVCSACSSSCASASPMTDSISTSSSPCDHTGLVRPWKRLKSALQSAHLPGFAQLNSRKTKKFQDLIVALFREGEGRVVLTFKTILICHKCGTGVVIVTPKCTKRISLLSRSLCQGWGSLLRRLLM